MLNTVAEFDIQELINKHRKPTFRKPVEWDVFYADAYENVYDTYEYISQLRNEVTNIDSFDKAQVLFYINLLEPKLNRLLNLMYKTGFKSQYYDRLWAELYSIRNEIPRIREQLIN